MTTKLVTINEVAKQMKLKPKTARKRARLAKNVPESQSATRWLWKSSQIAQVKKALAA